MKTYLMCSDKEPNGKKGIEIIDKKLWPTSAQISSETETEFLSELNCGLTQCSFIAKLSLNSTQLNLNSN